MHPPIHGRPTGDWQQGTNVDWLAVGESTPKVYVYVNLGDAASGSYTLRPCVRRTALALGLVVSTGLAYAGVRHHQFLNFDDPSYVTGNPNVLGGLSWDGVIWAFTASHSGNWHPLTWISHMADVSACGLNAGCHHVVNVAFHVLSALLLFRFLDRDHPAGVARGGRGRVIRASPAARRVRGLDRRAQGRAFHVLVDGGAQYICERRTAALAGRLAGLLTASALALLSKPMAVTLPFVLLLVDIWPLQRWNLGAAQAERWAGLRRRLLVDLARVPDGRRRVGGDVLRAAAGRRRAIDRGLPLGPCAWRTCPWPTRPTF